MLRLEMSYGGKVRHFPLHEDTLRLGRAADNDLVLAVPGVSRHHAMLRRTGAGFELQDLGSHNGLVSQGHRCDQVLLAPGGDAVQIGKAFLRVEHVASSDALVEIELPADSRGSAGPGLDRPPHSPSTSSLPTSGRGSKADAPIHLVRRIQRHGAGVAGQREQLLYDSCTALGAQGLAAFYLDHDGEPILIESCGRLDDEGMGQLSRLVLTRRREAAAGGGTAARAAAATESGTTRHGAQLLAGATGAAGAPVVASGRTAGDQDQLFLAATFPSPAAAAAAWRNDLLAYLRDCLFSGNDVSEEPLPLPAAGTLVFPAGMVPGTSPAIRALYAEMQTAAMSELDVLLLGETGTGKELFARLIHGSGPTARGPLLPLNTPAISAEMLESELFGVAGRVATGVDARAGLLEQAQGGTVLLDEIGDLSHNLQTHLLRFLQEREIRPVGGLPRSVKVRVIAATNRPLEQLVEEGAFRKDLYYRLRSLCFCLPPLRDRREDIPALTAAAIAVAARENHKRIRGISHKALATLRDYPWPGNIRELRQVVAQAVLRCANGGHIESRHFALPAAGTVAVGAARSSVVPSSSPAAAQPPLAQPPPPAAFDFSADSLAVTPLPDLLEAVEEKAIAAALFKTGGNKAGAARLLGITRYGLTLKLKRLAARRAAREAALLPAPDPAPHSK